MRLKIGLSFKKALLCALIVVLNQWLAAHHLSRYRLREFQNIHCVILRLANNVFIRYLYGIYTSGFYNQLLNNLMRLKKFANDTTLCNFVKLG